MFGLLLCISGLAIACSTLLSPGAMFKRDLVRGMGTIGVLVAAIPVASLATPDTPVITHKVFLDIKIANYTEESSGANRGAKGS